jgi:hypothetical protein
VSGTKVDVAVVVLRYVIATRGKRALLGAVVASGGQVTKPGVGAHRSHLWAFSSTASAKSLGPWGVV